MKTKSTSCNRREFLALAGTSTAGLALTGTPQLRAAAEAAPASNPLPRWRGFNLTNFFQGLSNGEEGQGLVKEDDLKWICDWGFDFVRLPMDYWMWIDSDWKQTRKLRPEDVYKIKTATLENIDRAVEQCQKHRLHLSLNFHRAPGYCINDPQREPFVLWSDRAAEDAFVHHWDLFAKRYRSISAKDLSFNLVNEAPSPKDGYMSREDYRRVMTRATEAIRRHRADRLIVIDGLSVGSDVVREMIPTKVAQSVHAYWPAQVSHYRASWVDRNSTFPEPAWPIKNPDGSVKMGREQMEKRFAPWGELARSGVGVHCGECGCFNRTPAPVFLAWFNDVMKILKTHLIGYALWNFRGTFGILNSGRKDVAYEDWHGLQLDRPLLTLLQKY